MKQLKIPKARVKKPKASKPLKIKATSKQRGATKPPKVRRMMKDSELAAIPEMPMAQGPGMDMATRVPANVDEAIPEYPV